MKSKKAELEPGIKILLWIIFFIIAIIVVGLFLRKILGFG